MKILFAVNIPFPEGGANTRRIHTIAQEMVKQGMQVSLLIPFSRYPTAKKQVVDGIDVTWCYVPNSAASVKSGNGRVRLMVQALSRILFLWEFLRLSLSNQYDWVYLYQPLPDACLAAVIARLTRHRVCSEFVDMLVPDAWPGLSGRILYVALVAADFCAARLSTVIFVISLFLEQRYRLLAPGVQIVRVPTIVDIESFGAGDPLRYRTMLGLSASKLIVYSGGLSKSQGVRVLIDAMALVCLEHKQAHLVIAGGNLAYDRDDVDVLIRQAGISEKATYLGILKVSDVIDLLASADVLVAPKLDLPVNHAGFSTKLAEYLVAGKPVVVSRVGDVSLYLRHREHALLCEPGCVEDLAANISVLLSDEELASRVGQQGRLLAKEVFGVQRNVAHMIGALYATSETS